MGLNEYVRLLKVGDNVEFPDGEGRLIGIRGQLATIYKSDGVTIELHVNSVYNKGDMLDIEGIGKAGWDSIDQAEKQNICTKFGIPQGFAGESWANFSIETRDFIKKKLSGYKPEEMKIYETTVPAWKSSHVFKEPPRYDRQYYGDTPLCITCGKAFEFDWELHSHVKKMGHKPYKVDLDEMAEKYNSDYKYE